MTEEKGSYVWVVVPRGWGYDDNTYNQEGFDLPESCFTLPEMAEEWVMEKNIQMFRNAAPENYFSGYTDFNSDFWEYVKRANPGLPYNKVTPEMIEQGEKDFCKEWNINMNTYCIDQADLDKMSDEKVLELMKILDLSFYTIAKVKIMC